MVSCIGCKGGGTQKDPGEVLSGELSLEMPTYDLGNNKVVKVLSHDESVFASSKESFEKAYGATFEVQVVPFDSLKTTFVNGVMANDSTDLARSFTAAIANKGLLAPLDDHINFSTNLWEGILPTPLMSGNITTNVMLHLPHNSVQHVFGTTRRSLKNTVKRPPMNISRRITGTGTLCVT